MRNKIIKTLPLFLFVFILLFTFISCKQKQPTDKELFEKFIVTPMPNTVKNLTVNYAKGTIDGNCTFSFKIGQNDFNRILKSRNFKKTDFLNFKLPKPFSEWSKTEMEIYYCKSTKKAEIYRMVTNKKHDMVYFVYVNY